MIEFYFLYDRDQHKARLCITEDGVAKEYYIDRIECAVPTRTRRQDDSPKFVVEGYCNIIIPDEENGELVMYLTD